MFNNPFKKKSRPAPEPEAEETPDDRVPLLVYKDSETGELWTEPELMDVNDPAAYKDGGAWRVSQLPEDFTVSRHITHDAYDRPWSSDVVPRLEDIVDAPNELDELRYKAAVVSYDYDVKVGVKPADHWSNGIPLEEVYSIVLPSGSTIGSFNFTDAYSFLIGFGMGVESQTGKNNIFPERKDEA